MLPEIKAYLETLEELRNQVSSMISGLSAEGLNWRPSLPEGADPTNSLGALAVHVAGSEHGWIAESVGAYPSTRVRDAEFKYVAASAEEPQQRLAAAAKETEAVLGALTQVQLEGAIMRDDHAVPTRWIIHHVIYHYSLHIGHMQLTYQLWNQGVAAQSPRWFQRLPRS